MAKLKDVAERANLSLSTVSRVLNSDKVFPANTRDRVWNAARELNYHPDHVARNLRLKITGASRRKTGLIAYVFCAGNNAEETELYTQFHSFRSYLMSLETAKRGFFSISACYLGEDWSFVCKPALDGLVDGVIAGTAHPKLIETLKKYVPVVLLDVPFSSETFGTPVVNINQRVGMWIVAKRLHELGHQRTGVLEMGDRLFGPIISGYFREAAAHYGIEIHADTKAPWCVSAKTHGIVMGAIAKSYAPLVKRREISAIVCPNDVYAKTLIESFASIGISVPGDCSVTGFNTMEIDRAAGKPAITGPAYSWKRMTSSALDVLTRHIETPESHPEETLIEADFIEGETIATPKGAQ